jgi:hypothetical protein
MGFRPLYLLLCVFALSVPVQAIAGTAPVKPKVAMQYFAAVCEPALPDFGAVDGLAEKAGLSKEGDGYVHPEYNLRIMLGSYEGGRPICALQFRTKEQESVVHSAVNALKTITLSTQHGAPLLHYKNKQYIATLVGNNSKKIYTLSLVGQK